MIFIQKVLFVAFFLLYFNVAFAQQNSNIGFGVNVGFKSPSGESGFVIEYKFKKVFDIYGGLSFAKFSGFGYSVGTDVFLLQKSWQPLIGIAYNYLSGDNFYVGDNLDRTDFKVNPINNFVGIIGIRKIISPDDKNENGLLAFTPYVSYRYSSHINKVVYVSGNRSTKREDSINNRIGDGLGIGLKVIYFINTNH